MSGTDAADFRRHQIRLAKALLADPATDAETRAQIISELAEVRAKHAVGKVWGLIQVALWIGGFWVAGTLIYAWVCAACHVC